MPELRAFFGKLRIGGPLPVCDAMLVPIHLPTVSATPLVDFLEDGRTTISEIDGREVLVRHDGASMLLLVDGEEIGAAQHPRWGAVNASLLVPPSAQVRVPMRRVDRGRWSWATAAFARVDSGRARKLRRSSGPARSPAVERLLCGVRVAPDQVGVALVRRDEVVLLEVLGSTQMFARAWKKIATGLLVELDDTRRAHDPERARNAVVQVLRALAAAKTTRSPAPGCGELVRATIGGQTLAATVHAGSVFHAVATGIAA